MVGRGEGGGVGLACLAGVDAKIRAFRFWDLFFRGGWGAVASIWHVDSSFFLLQT